MPPRGTEPRVKVKSKMAAVNIGLKKTGVQTTEIGGRLYIC